MNGFLFKKIVWPLRVLFAVGGLTLLIPGLVTDIIGLVIVVGLSGYQYLSARKGMTPAV